MQRQLGFSLHALFVSSAFLLLNTLTSACTGTDGDSEGEPNPEENADEGPTKCDYPVAPTTVKNGDYLPAFAWLTGTNEEGVETRIDMVDFYCNDDEWGSYNSLAVVAFPSW